MLNKFLLGGLLVISSFLNHSPVRAMEPENKATKLPVFAQRGTPHATPRPPEPELNNIPHGDCKARYNHKTGDYDIEVKTRIAGQANFEMKFSVGPVQGLSVFPKAIPTESLVASELEGVEIIKRGLNSWFLSSTEITRILESGATKIKTNLGIYAVSKIGYCYYPDSPEELLSQTTDGFCFTQYLLKYLKKYGKDGTLEPSYNWTPERGAEIFRLRLTEISEQ